MVLMYSGAGVGVYGAGVGVYGADVGHWCMGAGLGVLVQVIVCSFASPCSSLALRQNMGA